MSFTLLDTSSASTSAGLGPRSFSGGSRGSGTTGAASAAALAAKKIDVFLYDAWAHAAGGFVKRGATVSITGPGVTLVPNPSKLAPDDHHLRLILCEPHALARHLPDTQAAEPFLGATDSDDDDAAAEDDEPNNGNEAAAAAPAPSKPANNSRRSEYSFLLRMAGAGASQAPLTQSQGLGLTQQASQPGSAFTQDQGDASLLPFTQQPRDAAVTASYIRLTIHSPDGSSSALNTVAGLSGICSPPSPAQDGSSVGTVVIDSDNLHAVAANAQGVIMMDRPSVSDGSGFVDAFAADSDGDGEAAPVAATTAGVSKLVHLRNPPRLPASSSTAAAAASTTSAGFRVRKGVTFRDPSAESSGVRQGLAEQHQLHAPDGQVMAVDEDGDGQQQDGDGDVIDLHSANVPSAAAGAAAQPLSRSNSANTSPINRIASPLIGGGFVASSMVNRQQAPSPLIGGSAALLRGNSSFGSTGGGGGNLSFIGRQGSSGGTINSGGSIGRTGSRSFSPLGAVAAGTDTSPTGNTSGVGSVTSSAAASPGMPSSIPNAQPSAPTPAPHTSTAKLPSSRGSDELTEVDGGLLAGAVSAPVAGLATAVKRRRLSGGIPNALVLPSTTPGPDTSGREMPSSSSSSSSGNDFASAFKSRASHSGGDSRHHQPGLGGVATASAGLSDESPFSPNGNATPDTNINGTTGAVLFPSGSMPGSSVSTSVSGGAPASSFSSSNGSSVASPILGSGTGTTSAVKSARSSRSRAAAAAQSTPSDGAAATGAADVSTGENNAVDWRGAASFLRSLASPSILAGEAASATADVTSAAAAANSKAAPRARGSDGGSSSDTGTGNKGDGGSKPAAKQPKIVYKGRLQPSIAESFNVKARLLRPTNKGAKQSVDSASAPTAAAAVTAAAPISVAAAAHNEPATTVATVLTASKKRARESPSKQQQAAPDAGGYDSGNDSDVEMIQLNPLRTEKATGGGGMDGSASAAASARQREKAPAAVQLSPAPTSDVTSAGDNCNVTRRCSRKRRRVQPSPAAGIPPVQQQDERFDTDLAQARPDAADANIGDYADGALTQAAVESVTPTVAREAPAAPAPQLVADHASDAEVGIERASAAASAKSTRSVAPLIADNQQQVLQMVPALTRRRHQLAVVGPVVATSSATASQPTAVIGAIQREVEDIDLEPQNDVAAAEKAEVEEGVSLARAQAPVHQRAPAAAPMPVQAPAPAPPVPAPPLSGYSTLAAIHASTRSDKKYDWCAFGVVLDACFPKATKSADQLMRVVLADDSGVQPSSGAPGDNVNQEGAPLPPPALTVELQQFCDPVTAGDALPIPVRVGDVIMIRQAKRDAFNNTLQLVCSPGISSFALFHGPSVASASGDGASTPVPYCHNRKKTDSADGTTGASGGGGRGRGGRGSYRGSAKRPQSAAVAAGSTTAGGFPLSPAEAARILALRQWTVSYLSGRQLYASAGAMGTAYTKSIADVLQSNSSSGSSNVSAAAYGQYSAFSAYGYGSGGSSTSSNWAAAQAASSGDQFTDVIACVAEVDYYAPDLIAALDRGPADEDPTSSSTTTVTGGRPPPPPKDTWGESMDPNSFYAPSEVASSARRGGVGGANTTNIYSSAGSRGAAAATAGDGAPGGFATYSASGVSGTGKTDSAITLWLWDGTGTHTPRYRPTPPTCASARTGSGHGIGQLHLQGGLLPVPLPFFCADSSATAAASSQLPQGALIEAKLCVPVEQLKRFLAHLQPGTWIRLRSARIGRGLCHAPPSSSSSSLALQQRVQGARNTGAGAAQTALASHVPVLYCNPGSGLLILPSGGGDSATTSDVSASVTCGDVSARLLAFQQRRVEAARQLMEQAQTAAAAGGYAAIEPAAAAAAGGTSGFSMNLQGLSASSGTAAAAAAGDVVYVPSLRQVAPFDHRTCTVLTQPSAAVAAKLHVSSIADVLRHCDGAVSRSRESAPSSSASAADPLPAFFRVRARVVSCFPPSVLDWTTPVVRGSNSYSSCDDDGAEGSGARSSSSSSGGTSGGDPYVVHGPGRFHLRSAGPLASLSAASVTAIHAASQQQPHHPQGTPATLSSSLACEADDTAGRSGRCCGSDAAGGSAIPAALLAELPASTSSSSSAAASSFLSTGGGEHEEQAWAFGLSLKLEDRSGATMSVHAFGPDVSGPDGLFGGSIPPCDLRANSQAVEALDAVQQALFSPLSWVDVAVRAYVVPPSNAAASGKPEVRFRLFDTRYVWRHS